MMDLLQQLRKKPGISVELAEHTLAGRLGRALELLALGLFAGVLLCCGPAVESACAHPFGGVLQKTIISDLGHTMLIEYTTHFGPDLVLPLHPDRNRSNTLEDDERAAFLERVSGILSKNFTVRLGEQALALKEIDRSLRLEDERDYLAGLNSSFVYHLSLPPQVSGTEQERYILRFYDQNFREDEGTQLNYLFTVLDKSPPLDVTAEGRELLIDLTGRYLAKEKEQIASSPENVTGPPESPAGDPEGSDGGDKTLSAAVVREGQAPPMSNETGDLLDFLREKEGGLGFYLFGLLSAFVLGAFHALSPGHGKAMVAAYLVGTSGRIIDAVRLGIVVTVTHVLSVIVLGVAALILSRYTLSENFYPWLGVASGVLIFFTGYLMLARGVLAGGFVHDHHHSHHAPHSHHAEHSHASHSHNHDEDDHKGDKLDAHDHHVHPAHSPHPSIGAAGKGGRSFGEILSLGVAGGLVPCPSAIVILLFAIAINRIATGMLLILFFSLGLAAVLVALGILTVTASARLSGFGSTLTWVKRLPLLTALLIMVLGVGIGINSLLQAGILRFTP